MKHQYIPCGIIVAGIITVILPVEAEVAIESMKNIENIRDIDAAIRHRRLCPHLQALIEGKDAKMNIEEVIKALASRGENDLHLLLGPRQ